MAGTMRMYDGRVDVLPMTGKRLSMRTQIEGKYMDPTDFVRQVGVAVRETSVCAKYVAAHLTDGGYPAKPSEPNISIISHMLLIECVVEHEEPDDREGRILMDTLISRIIDRFNLENNIRR